MGGLTPEQAEILIGQEQAAASKRMKFDWEKVIDAVIKGEVLESSPGPSDQQQSGETRRHRLSGIGQITRELQKGKKIGQKKNIRPAAWRGGIDYLLHIKKKVN